VRRLKSRRAVAVLSGLVIVAVAAAVIGVVFLRESNVERIHEKIEAIHAGFKSGDPDAQTQIGSKTKNLGDPDSYAAEQIGALAYPKNSVSEALLSQERSFYSNHIKGRSKHSKNGW